MNLSILYVRHVIGSWSGTEKNLVAVIVRERLSVSKQEISVKRYSNLLRKNLKVTEEYEVKTTQRSLQVWRTSNIG